MPKASTTIRWGGTCFINTERLRSQCATIHKRQDRILPMQPQVLEPEAARKAARLKVRPARRAKPVERSCSADKEDFCLPLPRRRTSLQRALPLFHSWRLTSPPPAPWTPDEMEVLSGDVRVPIRQAADASVVNLSCAASSTATARSRETVGKSSRNASSEEAPTK